MEDENLIEKTKAVLHQQLLGELVNSLKMYNKNELYKSVLNAVEKPLIEKVLEDTMGNQIKAAKILGINRNTLRSKIRKLGIRIEKWKL